MFHEKRDEQNATGFADLRKRYEDVGMSDTERADVSRIASEAGDERICKAVCNLKTYPQQHGKDEENSHLLLLEKGEGL